MHKGFKCLSKSGRIFISRHVKFNEDEFCFFQYFPSAQHTSISNSLSLSLAIPILIQYPSSLIPAQSQNINNPLISGPVTPITQPSTELNSSPIFPNPSINIPICHLKTYLIHLPKIDFHPFL